MLQCGWTSLEAWANYLHVLSISASFCINVKMFRWHSATAPYCVAPRGFCFAEGNWTVGGARQAQTLEKSPARSSSMPQHRSARQKSQTLNKDRLDSRLQVNLQGWKKFAWFPLTMHFKITIYNFLCCLTEYLLCCPVYFILTTGFFKTFLGAWSSFAFSTVEIHAPHRCMGNVNGYRG